MFGKDNKDNDEITDEEILDIADPNQKDDKKKGKNSKSPERKSPIWKTNVIHKGKIYKKGESLPDNMTKEEIADLKKQGMIK